MSEKIKSCDKHKRGCNKDECKPGECEDYNYNHKRYNKFPKLIGMPMPEQELLAVCDDLVAARDTLRDADKVLEDAKDVHKAIKREQEKTIDECIDIMESKEQSISKEVEECFNYVDGTYSLTYQDEEGETVVVDDRPLTDIEKQDEMDVVLKQAEGKQKEAGDGEDDVGMTPKKVAAPQVPEEKIEAAIALIKEKKNCKLAMIQRGLNVSPLEANAILDVVEERGFIGPMVEGKAREILMDTEEKTEE